jgi:hypothetical protein
MRELYDWPRHFQLSAEDHLVLFQIVKSKICVGEP